MYSFNSGIEGVIQAYYQCIQTVRLYGPTNAAPIISHVARFADASQREEGTKGAHVSCVHSLYLNFILIVTLQSLSCLKVKENLFYFVSCSNEFEFY